MRRPAAEKLQEARGVGWRLPGKPSPPDEKMGEASRAWEKKGSLQRGSEEDERVRGRQRKGLTLYT